MSQRVVWIVAFATLSLVPAAARAQSPSVSVTSDGDRRMVVRGNLLLPLVRSEVSATLLDLQAGTGLTDSTRSLQAGLIYRRRVNGGLQLGGYGFAAYDRSDNGFGFATLAPGVEVGARRWRVAWNVYLPISSQTHATGPEAWGSELKAFEFTSFRGHTQLDRRVQPVDRVARGTDLIGTARLMTRHDVRLRLGTYDFGHPGASRGWVAGVEGPLTPLLSARLEYDYDAVRRSRLNLSIAYRFGRRADAPRRAAEEARAWQLRPVQHNIATSDTATSVPIVPGLLPVGPERVSHDNVWFFDSTAPAFSPANGVANCSYEHPCSGLNVQTLQSIAALSGSGLHDDRPALYLAPGTYAVPAGSGLALHGNESLIGRTAGFRMPATGDDRPVLETGIVGIFSSDGNQENRLEHLVVHNNGSGTTFPAAVFVLGVRTLTVDDVSIGTTSLEPSPAQFVHGLEASRNGSVHIRNSTIAVSNAGLPPSEMAFGLALTDIGDFTMDNSRVQSTAYGDGNHGARAIELLGGSTVTIRNSDLSAVSAGNDSNGAVVLLGADGASDTLRIESSRLSAAATGPSNGATVLQIGGGSNAAIDGSQLVAVHSAAGPSDSTVDEVVLNGAARLTIANSAIIGRDTNTAGLAAVTNFRIADHSQLFVRSSTATASGSATVQSGSTNITAMDSAQATVVDSTLITEFGGGPLVTEASGAVAIWTLGSSTVLLDRSTVTAIAGNNLTNPVVIESQDQSAVRVFDSTLSTIQDHGNMLPTEMESLVTVDDATVDLTNSLLKARLAGPSGTHGMIVVRTAGSSRVTLNGTTIRADNLATYLKPGAVTVGVVAVGTSRVLLSRNVFILRGGLTLPWKTFGGQVTFGQ